MSEEPREYLIKKGSYFYRPDCAGYTSFKFDAGRYTKERAEAGASIEPWHMQAIHQNDVHDASDPDKFIHALTAERDRLREENERLIAAAQLCIAYDDLLRTFTGPVSTISAADNTRIDAAYDCWIAAIRAALSPVEESKR
jgi:hypothetical protein